MQGTSGRDAAWKGLVIGQAKSGTTALCYAVKEQVPKCQVLFEPGELKQEQFESGNLVVKLLLGKLQPHHEEFFGHFEKRVFIERDIRDIIVSFLLYNVWDRKFTHDDEKLEAFIARIEEKEREPNAVSVSELYELIRELDGVDMVQALKRQAQRTMVFWRKHQPSFHLLKYGDFVHKRLGPLTEYLGFEVDPAVTVPRNLSRVTRTKSSADWKNWFTAADVERFGEQFRDYLEFFGYTDDWAPSGQAKLDPEFGSGYVRRITTERRNREKKAR